MTDPRRHLPLPGTINVRDVGGYPAADGRWTRWRTLLRADALHRLDDSGRAALAEIGLRTVVDLREDYEVERAPDALGDLPVEVARLRLLSSGGRSAPVRGGTAAPPTLEMVYDYLIDNAGRALAAAVSRLAVPGALPAVVHCSAGKDRTGLVTALVLDLVGVPDEVISQDYALTGEYLNPERTDALEQVAASSGLREMGLSDELFASPPELILASLARVRDTHGDARGYLVHHGASKEELDRLAAALLTEPVTVA